MSASAVIRPDAAPSSKVTVLAPVEGTSPARQAAEQLFKALLSSPSPDQQDARVLDDVLGTVSKAQDLKGELMSHATETVQVNEAQEDCKRIEAKAPAVPVRKRKSIKAVKGGRSQKDVRHPKEAKAILTSAPGKIAAEVSMLPSYRFEEEGPFMAVPRMEAARQNQQEQVWKPGERWKRRLRHMR